MSNNNNQIFNAAMSAYVQGAQQSFIADSVQADYAALVAAAAVFAAQVDAAIPTDGGIVTPTTSESLAKVNLLGGICESVMSGRYLVGTVATTSSTWTSVSAAIAACYNQAVTALALP